MVERSLDMVLHFFWRTVRLIPIVDRTVRLYRNMLFLFPIVIVCHLRMLQTFCVRRGLERSMLIQYGMVSRVGTIFVSARPLVTLRKPQQTSVHVRKCNHVLA